jgi:hypothetical protein
VNAQAEVLPDWEHYRLEEVQEALDGLDRDRYPDRARQLQQLIQQRRQNPKPAAPEALDFFEAVPDWQSYSLSELEEALQDLDRQRYPDRANTIRELIESRKSTRRRSIEESEETAPEQQIDYDDLPLLPWDVNLGRLGCYLLASIITAIGIAGLAVEPVAVALSLKTETGQPIGTLLLLLMALLVAYWPHRKRPA